MIGKPGRSSGVRTVASEAELNAIYAELSHGGTPIAGTYPGARVSLADGSTIGLRSASRSGGATIDMVGPTGQRLKVHIE